MYHIKEDKRSHASAKLICQAMLHCLTDRSWDELSITAICREASVSRATFYRLFDRLEDVAAYSHELMTRRFLSRIKEFPPKEALIYVFQDGMDFCVQLKALMQTRQDETLLKFYLHQQTAMRQALEQAFPQLEVTEHHCIVAAAALSGLLMNWFHRGKQETAPQLAEIFRRTMQDLSGYANRQETML